jgi:hypothetical protein
LHAEAMCEWDELSEVLEGEIFGALAGIEGALEA